MINQLLSRYELKGFSFGIFGASITFETKKEKQEVLRELFRMRNILSDFHYRFKEIEESYSDELELRAINNLFDGDLIVFKVYEKFIEAFFDSKYITIVDRNYRQEAIKKLDEVIKFKVAVEDSEWINSDPDFNDYKYDLILELVNLFDEIENEIKKYI